MPPDRSRSIFGKRRFLLFFMSQNLVSCSAFIQVVAVAQLIMKNTNSGFITGFSIVCAPLPGIIFSLFAGRLGDRLRTKSLLICFDVLRGLFILLFMFCTSAAAIFCLMMVINLLDVLYSPSRNKMLTSLIGKDDLIKGNSVINGGYGAVSLVVPMATGLLISNVNIHMPFILACSCYFISALLLSGLDSERFKQRTETAGRQREIVEGLKYCFKSNSLKKTIFTLAALDFGTVAVNIAFYSLAFDKLHVTSGHWGLLLSVFYGMNVFSMAFLYRCKALARGDSTRKIQLLLLAVTFVWFFYSFANQFHYILVGAAIEGFCSSLVSTALVTRIQENARKDFMARVLSIRDLCSSVSKIAGIGLAYLLMASFGVRTIFAVSAVLVLLFIVFQLRNKPAEKKVGKYSFRT